MSAERRESCSPASKVPPRRSEQTNQKEADEGAGGAPMGAATADGRHLLNISHYRHTREILKDVRHPRGIRPIGPRAQQRGLIWWGGTGALGAVSPPSPPPTGELPPRAPNACAPSPGEKGGGGDGARGEEEDGHPSNHMVMKHKRQR